MFGNKKKKVGAPVYALEDAKYLPKESIVEGRGTDASNVHDEEADEEEFSDDEEVCACLCAHYLRCWNVRTCVRIHVKQVLCAVRTCAVVV